jgi:Rrf2 family protein
MKMSVGVEWTLHCCVNLAVLGNGATATATRLAALSDLPAPYLTKHLQALVRAGILRSVPGPKGGFQLAREPSRISVLDVVVAVEGRDPAFRCTEIRAQGPARRWGSTPEMCTVEAAMRKGEMAWRRALAEQSLADLAHTFVSKYPAMRGHLADWFGAPAE